MDRFDRLFWHRLWNLVRPYWAGERRRRGLTLLITVVVLSVGAIAMNAVFSYVSRDVMNALQAKDAARFFHLMLLYVVWIILFVPVAAFYPYLTRLLAIEWRDWMTERFVRLSLDNHALYHITRDHSVDNPDQRISQDINTFSRGALTYSLGVLEAIITAGTFFGILWSISWILAVCLIGYAAFGTWLTVVIGRRLVSLNFDQQRYEADYRFALVHARDNAESIALYGGEADEARQLRSRFAWVVSNFKNLILWQRHLTFFTSTYNNAADLVPYFVLAGAYFAGKYELGQFTQAAFAFSMLQGSLSLIVNQFQDLTDYASVVNRLAAFKEQCERVTPAGSASQPRIEVTEGARVCVQGLTLMTPDYSRQLLRGLSFEVDEGGSLLITGPSGAGKTSLMRAIAGLWRYGSGRIVRPPLEEVIFLPQRPYMILGSLRDQLVYPGAAGIGDGALLAALSEVNLAGLADRFGGLKAELNWADVLSLGEQQRLAFARLLLNRPRYAFLDEATSALDEENENLLYGKVRAIGATVISVGHRSGLRKFHEQVVSIGAAQGREPIAGLNGHPQL